MGANLRIENVGEAAILTVHNICSGDIVDLVCSLSTQYRQDAVFLFDTPARIAIRRLKTCGGEYLWEGSRKNGVRTLLGHEIRLREDLPTTAKGKYPVIFANRTYAARQGWIDWPADLDWQCEYCGRINVGTRAGCVSCGGPRSWADYGTG